MIRFLLLIGLIIAPLTAARAQVLPDAPQLAAPGSYAVGVTTLTLTHRDQPDPAAPRGPDGAVARADRVLPLTIWYPAAEPADGTRARYAEHIAGTSSQGSRQGAAWDRAAPLRGHGFPLVVLSHGYFNWATGFSNLAEGLASRGYVVAAIDHHDETPSASVTQAGSFAMTVVSRSADQRFVISALARDAHVGPMAETYDPEKIALIGYSMGGFGALATAGAGFDPKSALYAIVPNGLLAPFAEGGTLVEAGAPHGLKAVVALAPWGGSPPLRAWSAAALSKITAPTLVIVGDHDDVSGYAEGVEWLYDHLTGADRYRLVYENAHHNIAGDGAAASPTLDFKTVERLEEPVWRRDRILAINRHFVTAFLDATLKGDAAHGAFLATPTVKADQGVWPLAQGQSVGDRFAAPDDVGSKGYWPGFQRRWALGLELYHDRPTAPAKP